MNKTTVAVISAVGGGIVGGVVTYLTVNRALRTRYEDWANSEIDSVKARYAQLNADSKANILEQAENPSPEVLAAVEKGRVLIEQMGYSESDEEETPHSTERTLSIFDRGVDPDNIPDEDEDDEDEDDDGYIRIDGEPFLIAEGEYFENEPDYQLDTLTYYEMDDTLTDEHNSQIDRVEETIGVRHLDMFKRDNNGGKSSLYIRNDVHETLYEVILVEQSYAAVILGMDEETLGLKEPKKRPRKMPKDHD